jgi:hypothetical protein
MASTLNFFCPTTHQPAPTRIKMNVQSLLASWPSTVKVDCPHRGQVHKISVRETYIGMALNDAVDRVSALRRSQLG